MGGADDEADPRTQAVSRAAASLGQAPDAELDELEYIARTAPPGLPRFITTAAVLSLLAEVRRLRLTEAALRERIALLEAQAPKPDRPAD